MILIWVLMFSCILTLNFCIGFDTTLWASLPSF
ncbi:hypothetical protein LINPERPRIM_LOCUS3507 [Linum perenne]